jgi:hypothetical protein
MCKFYARICCDSLDNEWSVSCIVLEETMLTKRIACMKSCTANSMLGIYLNLYKSEQFALEVFHSIVNLPNADNGDVCLYQYW